MLNTTDSFGRSRVIYKLLYLAQLADDAYYRAHGGTSLENFSILENENLVVSHWAHDTISITCSSHNDRGHHIPLQSAISSGCTSIEMTLFPAGKELLVGPNPEMLSRAMNLRDLYINPLLRTIQDYNKKLENLPSGALPQDAQLSGVFSNDPTQSLVLLLDFNADPERVWSHLTPHIEPLREAGFLTHYSGSTVVQGSITIVATGNVPLSRISEESIFRYIFFDAPLLKLLPPFDQEFPSYSDYNAQTSYYASADFCTAIGTVDPNGFSDKQLAAIRQQVQVAHGLGLKVRYTGTPVWPRKLRNYVWRILVREGVDIITVNGPIHQHQRTLE
ncbi:uncharacterized protein N7503_005967 [Penicillium pulvis]|uniref:uncharacterized protein n=1 Tax=Penicillium pulvis TaxID=1562058 RepID=UPI0025469D26|nr:uncharacterized protein N7503_005967 [Penicillium pulvis]KAJ5803517.1 hypothetical protein N7503_005967 [Penicillium pulvis]